MFYVKNQEDTQPETTLLEDTTEATHEETIVSETPSSTDDAETAEAEKKTK